MTKSELDRAWENAELDWYKAETAKYEAQADEARAAAEHERIKARQALAMAHIEELQLASAQRKEATYQAGDFENRVYRFNEGVRKEAVDRCIDRLNTWSRLSPGCSITIYLNSPGGDVISGMALFDEISRIGKTHDITTVSSGYAASMAGVLLQAGTNRVMARESWLLLHQGSMMIGGSMGEVEDFFEWGKKIGKRIVDIFYERSQASEAPKKLSKKQIETRMERKDWWIPSEEALEYGLCDEIW